MNSLPKLEKPIPVLIVEDDPGIRKALQRELTSRNFQVTTAGSAERAQELAQDEEFDVILLDLGLPGMDGLAFLKVLNQQLSPPQVIIHTGDAVFEKAVQALRLGAYDYLLKPADPDLVDMRLRQAAMKRQLTREVTRLQFLLADKAPSVTPVGKSPSYQKALTLAQMVAPTETPILLLGETGSGKEVLANYIHRISLRQKGPFVPINCAAIPENLMESEFFGHEVGAFTGATKRRPGYFEMAEGGTIFLDEIGEMDLGFQSKLLRVAETGTFFRVGGSKAVKVDVRIVSATNRDLLKEVNDGRFRADLYYRLQGFDIRIPPLRERREDIPFLVEHFLASRKGVPAQITAEALDCLAKAAWPGNIRELFHVLEKALIMAQGEPITLRHLPIEISGLINATPSNVYALEAPKATPAPEEEDESSLLPLEEIERMHILKVLDKVEGHQGRASQILGISPRTLYRKLKDYGRL